MKLPDIHKKRIRGKLGIQKVGIRQVRLPFTVWQRDGQIQSTIADVSIYCNLTKNIRGVNMSRFMTILHEYTNIHISVQLLDSVLHDIQEQLGASDAYVKFRFPYKMSLQSPITNNEGYEYYNCILEGRLVGNKFRFFLTVQVQYIATCSCSKALSLHLKQTRQKSGAPHMQRGYANITIEFDLDHIVYIEDIIDCVHKRVKTLPYPIIKREDEQEIARRCFENTYFVEEAARKIAVGLNSDKRIIDWVIVVNHDESIHKHTATAIIYKGKKKGLK